MRNTEFIKTVKNLLIAQVYSDAAKFIYIDENDPHYHKVEKIRNTADGYEKMINELYSQKDVYLKKAFMSALKESVPVYFDDPEGVLYFEFPFGQCSFHTFMNIYNNYSFPKNVEITEMHTWSGLENTRKLLRDYYANSLGLKFQNGGVLNPFTYEIGGL